MNACISSTAETPRATTTTITTIRALGELTSVHDLLTSAKMATDGIGAHEGAPLNAVISHALGHLVRAERNARRLDSAGGVMTAAITRHAAISVAMLLVGALAVPVSAAVRPTTIEALAMKFRDDCMSLDPTNTGCWIGFDETILDAPREDRVQSIYLTRAPAPFVNKVPFARPAPVPEAAPTVERWRSEFSKRPDDLKPEYANIIRNTDARLGLVADFIEEYYGGVSHG